MAQTQNLLKSNRSRKICVLGSSKHNGVTSLEWENVYSVNLADFHVVIVNVASLPVARWSEQFGAQIRPTLSTFIASGGVLIILGHKKLLRPDDQFYRDTNYGWCPINVDTINQRGDTVEPKRDEDQVVKFATHIKSWNFYYDKLTPKYELAEACKATDSLPIRLNVDPWITNRYGGLLAAGIVVEQYHKAIPAPQAAVRKFGDIILLPQIEESSSREGVDLILEEWFQLSQQSMPPAWVEQIVVPKTVPFYAEIEQNRTQIKTLNAIIDALESQIQKLNEYRKLLYGDGRELEELFSHCLQEFGGTVSPAKYSQEEFVLEYAGDLFSWNAKVSGKALPSVMYGS